MSNDENKQQKGTERYSAEFFGKLAPYIADIDITDINCNGKDVWINHIHKGRYMLDKEELDFTERDIQELAYKISNTENVQFNVNYPILQADLVDLRFHFTHASFSVSGTTCSIRKTPVVSRISAKTMHTGKVEYLTREACAFLKLAVRARSNIAVCGLTGSGKTELVKYLMRFTKPSERIITIEDTSELHLAEIYKEKDVVELKVNDFVDYDGAIKSCMRMLPVWVLLSEARGKEVQELLKCISTGAKIITTLHCENANAIPGRIMNMMPGEGQITNVKVENMIYDYLDFGIHIRADFEETTIRYVDQIVYYVIDEEGNRKAIELYKVTRNMDHTFNYTFHKERIPKDLAEKLALA